MYCCMILLHLAYKAESTFEILPGKQSVLAGLSVGSLLLSLLVLCLSDMWGSRLQVQAMQCHLRALQVRLAMSQARRLHPHTHRQGFVYALLEVNGVNDPFGFIQVAKLSKAKVKL